MLTYELKKMPGIPLYEALYRCLRQSILTGELACGEKLPSKRALAEHLEVSKITVETAYAQLLAEGYIRSREKVGYFVEPVVPLRELPEIPSVPQETVFWPLDLTDNGPAQFPFSVWSRLQREVMLDLGEALLRPVPNQGYFGLRRAIAVHLAQFRGMQVDPENIIIGAGTDFLYNLIIQLLDRDKIYAVEEPGYGKIRRIYTAGGVKCIGAPIDEEGVCPSLLGNARVLHISPSHHFPTGLVTSMARRLELLNWAKQADGYIIEDDYDSEFRFHAHPMSAMFSLDRQDRVIYLNTFSKTLAPSIRISYMVLPPALMNRFQQKLGFYSCTVSAFEQYTLERFLREGHFEKHINRMRRFYKSRRNRVLEALQSCPWAKKMTIREENAGLHFLIRLETDLSDGDLTALFARQGIRVRCLSEYFGGQVPADMDHTLVINYSDLQESELFRLQQVET